MIDLTRHLQQVSRSFSFCIAELTPPFQQWVGVSYLLCRVLDTIEDEPWSSLQSQCSAFQQFETSLLDRTVNNADVLFELADRATPAEGSLIKEFPALLECFQKFPVAVQSIIEKYVLVMKDGMKHFVEQQHSPIQFVLDNRIAVNQYCFFVAGTVGLLLSELFVIVCPNFSLDEVCRVQSLHFGFFLQKINMLKDKDVDEGQGRSFINHCLDDIRQSLATHARLAMDYIKTIPAIEGRSYRLFCAWSLFIGLASLPWIDDSLSSNVDIKIPRKVTTDLVFRIKKIISDDLALEKLFEQYRPDGHYKRLRPSSHTSSYWYSEIFGEEWLKKYQTHLGMALQ